VARGRLRIYLGAAPGVGKTFAMLNEGRRRVERGTDVVVGIVETHGRPRTQEQLEGLEQVPRRRVEHRGAVFEEMDLDAVLARRPEVALVDELAHTNVPGSGRHAKRWQDVEELLAAGITVVSTVNVQHLESLNDVVQTITGVPQRETVPDEVVRQAEQVELVDMSPEALRRRMAHGNVYAADKVDAALAKYFRVGNLTALRELALLWLADKVDEGLRKYRQEHEIGGVWEARERVVVALTGGAEGETLIRRAARIAARATGGDLLAVHVSRSDGLTGASPARLEQQRALVESLGGSYHQVVGDDVPAALLDFARGVNATQLVLGASRRPRWAAALTEGIGATVTRLSGPIDVHMVTHEAVGTGRALPRLTGGLTVRRRLAGLGVGAAGCMLLTAVLVATRGTFSLASEMLLYLTLVVLVALVGGVYPAVLTAVAASLLLNWFFTPPLYTFDIAVFDNALALVVFVVVAAAVSSVVDLAARRTAQAARSRAESELLSTVAGSVLRGEQALPALLERVREAFALTSVTLLERDDGRAPWRVVGCAGPEPCASPAEGDTEVAVDEDLHLALRGRVLPAEDRRVLAAFAVQAAVALRQQRLSAQAAEAGALGEANAMRTALLTAVGHDLRTPLASIKAAVSSLRSPDVTWGAEDEAELLAAIEESADHLDALVADLLDMSRLQTGVVRPVRRPVGLDEVVPGALAGLASDIEVEVDVPEDLPRVLTDAGLLRRVVGNLVHNAVRHAGNAGGPIAVRASSLGGRVELRVVDRGRGIPAEDRELVFEPFQRLGDRDNDTGVGLGLAVARGLTEVLGGTLTPEDTPGGGLTMIVSLPAAPTPAPAPGNAPGNTPADVPA